MRVSLYGAVNMLLAAMWVVFIPSYAMLVHCKSCPNFLKAAGEIVELLWHPNTHRVKLKYGATSGSAQFVPDSDNGVYRPACVPCPVQLVAQQAVPYSNKDNQTSGSVNKDAFHYNQLEGADLARCVKVDGFNLPPGAPTSITGGAGVDAKTYVHYQLFGPDHVEIMKKLYTVGLVEGHRKARDLAWIRQQVDSQVRSGKTFFNTKLFKRRSPWPYINAPLGDETIQPVIYGYYMLNGRPFIPPKLWDYRPFSQSNGDRYFVQLKDSTKKHSITSNITNLTSAASYTASGYMVGQANGHQPGAIEPRPMHDSIEHEWWYNNVCPKNGCGEDWALKTSLQYWGTDHYADYIARFFAGGKDFTCVWFGS
jgi:hypothetical protein